MSQPSGGYETAPAPVFQATPDFGEAVMAESPVFQSVPEPQMPETFQPTLEPDLAPAFQPDEAPAQSATPATDRVDDLLRQFRERYGRGSM